MSRGLGKIERLILDTCLECLTLKEKMLEEYRLKGYADEFYLGGERNVFASGKYERCVYVGSEREKIIYLPEDVIDLREVSYRVKRSKGKKFMEGSLQAAHSRAIRSLNRKGYFKNGHPWRRWRFVRLNMDKFKRYENMSKFNQ